MAYARRTKTRFGDAASVGSGNRGRSVRGVQQSRYGGGWSLTPSPHTARSSVTSRFLGALGRPLTACLVAALALLVFGPTAKAIDEATQAENFYEKERTRNFQRQEAVKTRTHEAEEAEIQRQHQTNLEIRQQEDRQREAWRVREHEEDKNRRVGLAEAMFRGGEISDVAYVDIAARAGVNLSNEERERISRIQGGRDARAEWEEPLNVHIEGVDRPITRSLSNISDELTKRHTQFADGESTYTYEAQYLKGVLETAGPMLIEMRDLIGEKVSELSAEEKGRRSALVSKVRAMDHHIISFAKLLFARGHNMYKPGDHEALMETLERAGLAERYNKEEDALYAKIQNVAEVEPAKGARIDNNAWAMAEAKMQEGLTYVSEHARYADTSGVIRALSPFLDDANLMLASQNAEYIVVFHDESEGEGVYAQYPMSWGQRIKNWAPDFMYEEGVPGTVPKVYMVRKGFQDDVKSIVGNNEWERAVAEDAGWLRYEDNPKNWKELENDNYEIAEELLKHADVKRWYDVIHAQKVAANRRATEEAKRQKLEDQVAAGEKEPWVLDIPSGYGGGFFGAVLGGAADFRIDEDGTVIVPPEGDSPSTLTEEDRSELVESVTAGEPSLPAPTKEEHEEILRMVLQDTEVVISNRYGGPVAGRNRIFLGTEHPWGLSVPRALSAHGIPLESHITLRRRVDLGGKFGAVETRTSLGVRYPQQIRPIRRPDRWR